MRALAREERSRQRSLRHFAQGLRRDLGHLSTKLSADALVAALEGAVAELRAGDPIALQHAARGS